MVNAIHLADFIPFLFLIEDEPEYSAIPRRQFFKHLTDTLFQLSSHHQVLWIWTFARCVETVWNGQEARCQSVLFGQNIVADPINKGA